MITYRNFRIKKTGYIYIRNKLIGGKKDERNSVLAVCGSQNLGTDDRIDMPQFTRMVDTFPVHTVLPISIRPVYHGGKSEGALRQALVERHPRGF